MAEQAVDAGAMALHWRLRNALAGVELTEAETASLEALLSLGSTVVYDVAGLIERARYAGRGGSSRTEVLDFPGRHRKQVPAVGPSYQRKEGL